MPLTIKSKLLEKKSFAGMPSAGTDVALMDIATNLLIFSTIINIVYLCMIVDRKTEPELYGAVMGGMWTACVAATTYAFGGIFNPIRLIGGFASGHVDIKGIPTLLAPFAGAILGQCLYKYVLSDDDLAMIFADDEEEH